MTTSTVTVVLYQLDHLSARFRHEGPTSVVVAPGIMMETEHHDVLGLDLPQREWVRAGRPATLTLTIDATPASADPQYKVGDPDPTPDLDVAPYCMAQDPASAAHCTWQAEHDGDHVAGNGEIISAVWSS